MNIGVTICTRKKKFKNVWKRIMKYPIQTVGDVPISIFRISTQIAYTYLHLIF